MAKKSWGILLGVLIIIILLVGYAFNTDVDKIRVGYSGALTGGLASLGENNLRGVELAVDEINAAGGIDGKQIKLFIQDDQFEGIKTLDNYEKFKLDDVDVVLTTTYGGILTTAPRADIDEIVVINTVDSSDEIAGAGDYVFASGIYDEGIGFTIAEFLIESGEEETVLLYNQEDPFVSIVKEAFVSKYLELGGEVRESLAYDPNSGDFRSQLTKTKDINPNYMVIIGFDEQGLLLKQARDVGIESVFVGIDTFSSQVTIDTSEGAIDGAYFTFWDKEAGELDDFIAKYNSAYGEDPSQILFAVTGYDTMMIVAEAMKNNNHRGAKLKDSLYSIDNYPGLSGDLTMSEDGIVRSVREEIFQINGNEFVRI